MTTDEFNPVECHPLKQEKVAQKMYMQNRNKKIKFLLITPITSATCEWVDPYLGIFCLDDNRERGVFRVSDLPEGTMITGTRYAEE